MRLLLVEDHPPLAEAIASALERGGFAIDTARSLADAREAAALVHHDLVVLDLGLPDGDGLTLLAELGGPAGRPVIVLTARDGVADRVAGLDEGADDYVVKPVEMSELIARCRAVLRRPGGRLGTVLSVGPVSLEVASREVAVHGRGVPLGRRETGVLEHLMRRKGRVVTRRALEEAIYGFDEEVSPNALEAAVSRLRRALEAAGAPLPIHTVRGVGWVLADEEADR